MTRSISPNMKKQRSTFYKIKALIVQHQSHNMTKKKKTDVKICPTMRKEIPVIKQVKVPSLQNKRPYWTTSNLQNIKPISQSLFINFRFLVFFRLAAGFP